MTERNDSFLAKTDQTSTPGTQTDSASQDTMFVIVVAIVSSFLVIGIAWVGRSALKRKSGPPYGNIDDEDSIEQAELDSFITAHGLQGNDVQIRRGSISISNPLQKKGLSHVNPLLALATKAKSTEPSHSGTPEEKKWAKPRKKSTSSFDKQRRLSDRVDRIKSWKRRSMVMSEQQQQHHHEEAVIEITSLEGRMSDNIDDGSSPGVEASKAVGWTSAAAVNAPVVLSPGPHENEGHNPMVGAVVTAKTTRPNNKKGPSLVESHAYEQLIQQIKARLEQKLKSESASTNSEEALCISLDRNAAKIGNHAWHCLYDNASGKTVFWCSKTGEMQLYAPVGWVKARRASIEENHTRNRVQRHTAAPDSVDIEQLLS